MHMPDFSLSFYVHNICIKAGRYEITTSIKSESKYLFTEKAFGDVFIFMISIKYTVMIIARDN